MGLAGPVSAQLPLCATSRPTNVEGTQLHLFFVLGSTGKGSHVFTDEISNASRLLRSSIRFGAAHQGAYGLVSSAAVGLLLLAGGDTAKPGTAQQYSPAAKLRSFFLNRETGSHGVAPSPPKHTRHITTYPCDRLRVNALLSAFVGCHSSPASALRRTPTPTDHLSIKSTSFRGRGDHPGAVRQPARDLTTGRLPPSTVLTDNISRQEGVSLLVCLPLWSCAVRSLFRLATSLPCLSISFLWLLPLPANDASQPLHVSPASIMYGSPVASGPDTPVPLHSVVSSCLFLAVDIWLTATG